MHQLMSATLDTIMADIQRIQVDARTNGFSKQPRWPMLILRTPKGWTGPKIVDGQSAEGTFRSHQVPMGAMDKPGHLELL
jgi:xylulose-5-phosphate/fructose-6-phosphate phosphoketolase